MFLFAVLIFLASKAQTTSCSSLSKSVQGLLSTEQTLNVGSHLESGSGTFPDGLLHWTVCTVSLGILLFGADAVKKRQKDLAGDRMDKSDQQSTTSRISLNHTLADALLSLKKHSPVFERPKDTAVVANRGHWLIWPTRNWLKAELKDLRKNPSALQVKLWTQFQKSWDAVYNVKKDIMKWFAHLITPHFIYNWT